jgi:hypothetical protein
MLAQFKNIVLRNERCAKFLKNVDIERYSYKIDMIFYCRVHMSPLFEMDSNIFEKFKKKTKMLS